MDFFLTQHCQYKTKGSSLTFFSLSSCNRKKISKIVPQNLKLSLNQNDFFFFFLNLFLFRVVSSIIKHLKMFRKYIFILIYSVFKLWSMSHRHYFQVSHYFPRAMTGDFQEVIQHFILFYDKQKAQHINDVCEWFIQV